MSDKIKVMTILGTRPDIIRLARVIAKLDKYTDHILIHTGQNYDYELNKIFFDELGVRKPDYMMESKGTLGEMVGKIIIETEKLILKEKPDAVLILGDVNSSLSCIIVKRMKIPLYHMEAGNRSFDPNVPEEINRKIIDHLSDINFVYTEHARRNLIAEGIHRRKIYLTGSPMKEVIDFYIDKIKASKILKTLSLEKGNYFLVTMHREDNVDNSENLKKLLNTLNMLAEKYKKPIIISTHPRTRNRLEKIEKIKMDERIQFLKPFGFYDFCNLQINSFCVVSDSGSISEEASMLGFPAITIRNSIERPEALDTGNIIMTGLDEKSILSSIEISTKEKVPSPIPFEYTITNTSDRVVRFILGTTKLIHKWDGVIKTDLTYKQ